MICLPNCCFGAKLLDSAYSIHTAPHHNMNHTFWGFWSTVVLVALGASRANSTILDCRNVTLTAPALAGVVSGVVEIRGQAQVPGFQFFKVEYAPQGSEKWALIGTDVTQTPVTNGRLALWQTGLVPDGVYSIRLRVVDVTGNYCEASVQPVTVTNRVAASTPVPPTETPELTFVPPQPSVTVPVAVPVEFAPPKSTPGAIPTRSPIAPPDSDFKSLAAFFLFGAAVTLAGMVFIGVVLAVRRFS